MRTALSTAMVIAIMAFASLAAAQAGTAWLGVSLKVVEQEEAKSLGISGGLKVSKVVEKSPAESAGLNVGDVILAVGQDSVSTIEGMGKIIGASRPGDLLTLGVRREGGKTDVVIATLARAPGNEGEFEDDARVKELREQLQKLDAERRRIFADLEKRLADLRGGKADKESERPAAPRVDTPPQPQPEEIKPTPEEPRRPLAVSIGAALLDLTPEERKKLSVEGGVKVTRVVAQGAAEEAGVKADDVITKVGDETLTGTGHLRVVLGKLNPGDKLALEVLRDGKKISIDVTLRPAK